MVKYGSMDEIFDYIRSKEEPREYFLVSERGDQLGYILTRAAPPREKRLVRAHTKLDLRKRGAYV